jgi:hypothetical protein
LAAGPARTTCSAKPDNAPRQTRLVMVGGEANRLQPGEETILSFMADNSSYRMVPPPEQRSRFTWLSDVGATVQVRHTQGVLGDHDPDFHADLVENDPFRFCSTVVQVLGWVGQGTRDLRLTTCEIPYCHQQIASMGSALGWAVLVTVDGGQRIVLSKRSMMLSDGGKWNLSASESAEPEDLRANIDTFADLDLGRIAGRALCEELGLNPERQAITDATRLLGVFQCSGEVNGLLHVAGEKLGLSGQAVLVSHQSAVDRWEGDPCLVASRHDALEALGKKDGWLPWSWPCLQQLLRHHR